MTAFQQHFGPLFISLFLLSAASGLAARTRVELDFDNMLKVNGQRTFVIGCYENPGTDAGLAELAVAGFNLVSASPSAESLDKLAARGLYAWVNLGYNLNLAADEDKRRSALASTVEALREHSALLVWEGPDEALWNIFYPHNQPDAPRKAREAAAGFLRGYNALKQLDPDHPLWFNHAPRNTIAALAEFNRACDISGCDIYPVPPYRTGHSDLADRSLSSVGAYTERMKQAGGGNAIWMVLQGFGWWDLRTPGDKQKHLDKKPEGRRPTLAESRFMAYDAVVHGATAILYWGTAYVEKDSQFWAELKTLTRELAVLRPLLEEPTLSCKPWVEILEDGSSRDRGLAVMAKRHEGALYLIIVNEDEAPATFTLSGLEAYQGAAFHSLFKAGMPKVTDGALSGSIPGNGVDIWTNGTAFDGKVEASAPDAGG